MTLAGILHALRAHWPLLIGAYLVLSVPVAFAAGWVLRHCPAPDVWHCSHCDDEFNGATVFADHVFAEHPDALPRIDA